MGQLVVWRGTILGLALRILPGPDAGPGAPVATAGRVVDEAGLWLPGAVVRVVGRPRIVTSTDAEGRFRLRRPAHRDSLVVTATGYQAARVRARDGQTIVLREDSVVTEQLRDLLRRGGTY